MKIVLAVGLLLIAASNVGAQLLAPTDTTSAYTNRQRPLPPSILSELRRSQKNRTLVYHDTLRGSDLTRQHFNDSLSREYADSAIAVYDIAVSMPHKEWLDSELVEIPELSRFGNRVHFNYPASIMTETDLTEVPFDSTLLLHMNPVIRENLPYFDQSPMPMPLVPSRRMEAFLEAGGGDVNLPLLRGWLSQALSPRTLLQLSGDYKSNDGSVSAIRDYTNIKARLGLQLGPDPAASPFQSTSLDLIAGFNARSIVDTANDVLLQTQKDIYGGTKLQGDASELLHYDASVLISNLSLENNSELSENITAGIHYDPFISHFRFIIEGGYDRASANYDAGQGSNLFGSPNASNAISANYIKALFGRRKGDAIEWYGGVEYLRGSDISGTISSLTPIARVRIPLNARWELGAGYEPQIQLATWHELLKTNPFFTPTISSTLDRRSVTLDKFNFAAFMNYALSTDDLLRLEMRMIERHRETIFEKPSSDSGTFWPMAIADTRRFEVVATGNFLLFTRDILSASAELHSASIVDSDKSLPFEPVFSFTTSYHFNSIFEKIRPVVEFRSISRTDKTIDLLNAEINADLFDGLSATLRAENILGSVSDFWPGFPEYPRAIVVMARYAF